MTKRDSFLMYIMAFCRKHEHTNWPEYNEGAGGAGGTSTIMLNALSVPEVTIPDDWKSAANEFLYYLRRWDHRYWADAVQPPAWLPAGWLRQTPADYSQWCNTYNVDWRTL